VKLEFYRIPVQLEQTQQKSETRTSLRSTQFDTHYWYGNHLVGRTESSSLLDFENKESNHCELTILRGKRSVKLKGILL
jgi:hypothetical protein